MKQIITLIVISLIFLQSCAVKNKIDEANSKIASKRNITKNFEGAESLPDSKVGIIDIASDRTKFSDIRTDSINNTRFVATGSVRLKPGIYFITAKYNPAPKLYRDETLIVAAKIEQGKRYRFLVSGDSLKVVEK